MRRAPCPARMTPAGRGARSALGLVLHRPRTGDLRWSETLCRGLLPSSRHADLPVMRRFKPGIIAPISRNEVAGGGAAAGQEGRQAAHHAPRRWLPRLPAESRGEGQWGRARCWEMMDGKVKHRGSKGRAGVLAQPLRPRGSSAFRRVTGVCENAKCSRDRSDKDHSSGAWR